MLSTKSSFVMPLFLFVSAGVVSVFIALVKLKILRLWLTFSQANSFDGEYRQICDSC